MIFSIQVYGYEGEYCPDGTCINPEVDECLGGKCLPKDKTQWMCGVPQLDDWYGGCPDNYMYCHLYARTSYGNCRMKKYKTEICDFSYEVTEPFPHPVYPEEQCYSPLRCHLYDGYYRCCELVSSFPQVWDCQVEQVGCDHHGPELGAGGCCDSSIETCGPDNQSEYCDDRTGYCEGRLPENAQCSYLDYDNWQCEPGLFCDETTNKCLSTLPIDTDGDGIVDDIDNCRDMPNGPAKGTCVGGTNNGEVCYLDSGCSGQYFSGESAYCSLNQEDSDVSGIGASDGKGDACDNCPYTFNIEQIDLDKDGVGYLCDNCPGPINYNPLQEDTDLDGAGNICDNCIDVSNPPNTAPTDCNADGDTDDPGEAVGKQCDIDADKIGDVCDLDSDNDGINDDGDGSGVVGDNTCTETVITGCDDNCPNIPNGPDRGTCILSDNAGDPCTVREDCPIGEVAFGVCFKSQADVDLDGLGTLCDNCPAISNINQLNDDDDTWGNLCDNCPDDANQDQSDIDGDSWVCNPPMCGGDVCDTCDNTINCLLPPDSTECVDQYTFYPVSIPVGLHEDSICEKGNWTTRTRLVAMQLLKIAGASSPNDYTLFCDQFDDTLGYYDYSIGGVTAEQHLQNIRGQQGSVCVLKLPNTAVFGSSLNKPIDDGSPPFLSALEQLPSQCDDAKQTDNIYHQCGAAEVWYNKKIETVIYSKDNVLSIGTEMDPYAWDEFTDWLADPFKNIFAYLRSLFKETGTSLDYAFLQDAKEFSKIYIGKNNAKSIHGIIEPAEKRHISVTYIGYTPEDGHTSKICSTTEILNAKLPSDELCHCDNRPCNATCSYIPETNSHYVVSNLHPACSDYGAFWKGLTSELRPKR
ncbi:MAG: hypothetical protein U9O94_05765 [Nanoarchaeota archaeon]|nr:hypothetical protein [Nanoarchaeota archaeon]